MIEPIRAAALQATEPLARLSLVVETQQLCAQPLLDVLKRFDESALRDMFVGVDHTFSWVGVRCVCPRDKHRGAIVDYLSQMPRHAQSLRILDRGAENELIELRLCADNRVRVQVHSVGARGLDEDLQLVSELAELSADSAVLFGALARELAAAGGQTHVVSDGDAGVTTLGFALPNDSAKVMAKTLGALDAVAAGLQATGPQRELLRTSHQTLCLSRPCFASLSMQNQRLMMKVGISYQPMSWDNTTQLLQALHPGAAAGQTLAMISASCSSGQASFLEIELGPCEPPGLLVWAAMTMAA